MTATPKHEDAVTGRQNTLNRGHVGPSPVEGYDLIAAPEAAISRPNVAGCKSGPKGYCQVFKASEWSEVWRQTVCRRRRSQRGQADCPHHRRRPLRVSSTH